MRKFFYLLLFLTTLFNSQTTSVYDNILITVSPASPEANRLGTFGSVPVGLINGTPNVSIPLTSLNVGGINIPVSMNYSRAGVKVDELEGYIGLGWQLIAGGVITRTIKDLPDEDQISHFPENDVSAGISSNQINAFQYLDHIQDDVVDSEPDKYSFNFPGYSGSFIFNNQQEAIQLNQTDLKISRKSETGLGYYFEIVDHLGNIYEFKDLEKTLFLKSTQGSTPYTRTSAWFLSRIYIKKNHGIINFIYNDNEYTYKASNIRYLEFNQSRDMINYGSGVEIPGYTPELSAEGVFSRLHIYTKELKTISSSDYGSLEFTFSKNSVINSSRLENIIKKAENGTIIDNINFNYLVTPNQRIFLNYVENTVTNEKHSLEYINPIGLPTRLSFAQDYYGYYNGVNDNKNLIPDNYKKIFVKIEDQKNLANREPNILYNKTGLLNKIIYPTKGFTILNYEGNNEKNAINQVYIPEHQDFDVGGIAISRDSNGQTDYTYSKLSHYVDSAKKYYFKGTVVQGGTDCVEQPGSFSCTFRILKDGIQVGSTSFNIGIPKIYELDLDAGNYIFEAYSLTRNCSSADIQVGNTPIIPGHYINVPSNITGSVGSRIKSISTKDNNIDNITYYKYNDFEELYPKDFLSYRAKYVDKQPGEKYTQTFIRINSDDQKSFYDFSNDYYYGRVDVSYGGDNFEKGGESHYFDIAANSPNLVLSGFANNDYKIFSYDEWNSAQEYKIEYFDKDQIKQKQVENFFGERSSKNKSYYGISAHQFVERRALFEPDSTVGYCSGNNDPWFPQCQNLPAGTQVGSLSALYNVEIFQYKINSFNKFLESQKTTNYINNVPLEATTEYFYNNPLHYQLTNQKTTFPDNTYQTIDYSYAVEKNNQKLIDANMIGIPLVTETKKNGKTISKTETVYPDTLPDNQTGSLLLPKSVSALDLLTGNMSVGLTCDRYDYNGNLLQYTTKEGVPVAIVWGYNQTYPIAKIQGASYPDPIAMKTTSIPQNLVDAIISASNDDAADIAVGNPKEQDLLNALDAFRNSSELSGYQITTYTYDPLIGVRSITPPSGVREVYIYDTSNRLKEVKDLGGNILKEYQYHYKP